MGSLGLHDTASLLEPGGTFALSDGLIGSLLDEQADLTAVERFAQFHGSVERPLQGKYYSSLLPGKLPGAGQQYAFEVDLDRCSGCKACVAACHALNGLDEGEVWREVGLIVGGAPGLPVIQHVTSACHHCLDPACLNACPVDAYEKDPITGIVKHLTDQCFGCQYCTLACPYDAPRFHAAKGVVRKCDMCSDRLGVGEAPACVQGCPHEAISIRIVDKAVTVAIAESTGFLPTAPDPSHTLPTTRYVTERPWRGALRAADSHRNEPEHAHPSLVLMLVLTQAAVGGFLVDATARVMGIGVPFTLTWMSLVLGMLGLGASLCHLGRPLYAYRAIIGFRHSWLSREVAAFGLFAASALAHAVTAARHPDLTRSTAIAAALAGVLAVYCSVMVYHVVRRPFWHFSRSGPKFAGTAISLGIALALMVSNAVTTKPLALGLMVACLIKLGIDGRVLVHLRDPRTTLLKRTAALIRGPLAHISLLRLALGIVGGMIFPSVMIAYSNESTVFTPTVPAWLSAMTFATLLAGEIAERTLFFAAVVRPKMPGGLPS